ncbi:MAG: hypothetical protein V4507_00770 [Verrucomicrobiota bacterium]
MRKRLASSRKNFSNIITCRHLIHVENPPIKKILIDRYQSYIDQIHQLKSKLELFELQDEPAYESWMKQNFSKIVHEIQQIKSQSSELQNRFTEAELIALRYGISLEEAYRKVLEKTETEKDKKDDPDCADPEESDFRDSFEKTFGFRPQKSPKIGSCNQRRSLKETYRFLARKLHPDMRTVSHPHWDDLWFEAQFAYQTCNLEDLNRVALIVEAHESVHSDHPHLSTVFKVNIVFEKQIYQLENQMKTLQRGPAWEYSKSNGSKADLKSFLSKTKYRLEGELKEAQVELKHYQAMEKDYRPTASALKSSKSASKTGKSKPRAKKTSLEDFFSS